MFYRIFLSEGFRNLADWFLPKIEFENEKQTQVYS